MKNRMITFGVIGAGRIGKLHAENLSACIPNTSVKYIADIILDEAQKTAKKLHIPYATSNYREILEDPEVDAVAICSSTDTHAQIIIESAAAGKDIFCEKPIDYDLTKIDAALNAVEKAGVKLQIGFNRRFDPNFRKLREMVADGKIGTPHILRIISRDPAPPPIEYIKVSGGIFFDMTIHDFDMARYMIDSEVSEIFVAGGVMVDPAIGDAGDIDTAVITLRFENGAIGTIDNSRQAVYGYDQRVEVFGSGGMVTAGNNLPDTHIYSNAEGVFSSKPLYFFLERYTESFLCEMRGFVDAIQTNGDPPVSGIDGRIPVLMGMAAKKSFLEGRPVKLSELDDSVGS
jgi:myo-inositol 2-dehydrogenase/D-chiro-inositol 1-dehydrogenase